MNLYDALTELALAREARNKAIRFYDDWLTADLPDDEGNDYEDDDRSDEQFDRWDRERTLT